MPIYSHSLIVMICSQEPSLLAGTRALGRFVSENKQGQSDINTVSSPHVEMVVLMSKADAKV